MAFFNIKYYKKFFKIISIILVFGFILAITNQDAEVLEKRWFDAWGNIVQVADGQGNTLDKLTVLDRGYTGHEHLQSVGLIHMNGRLYDPLLHRFLAPDNYVQDPYNTQNFNRYGYVLNNPLMYTDPSGEWVHTALGALIGGVVNVVINWDNIDGFWDGLTTFAAGAGAGAAKGFVVSALNHAAHDDNGYDKNGRKINNNEGDEIDYLYDDFGAIVDSRLVETSRSATTKAEFRMYGIRVKAASRIIYKKMLL